MMEYAAAAHFNIPVDPSGLTPNSWYTLPREARASMTAYVQLESIGAALHASDDNDQREQAAEIAAARKGGK